jgi:hypothetical protein
MYTYIYIIIETIDIYTYGCNYSDDVLELVPAGTVHLQIRFGNSLQKQQRFKKRVEKRIYKSEFLPSKSSF